MQSVTIDHLDRYFSDLLKTIPEERRAMFEELSEELLSDVRGRIGGAGKVQRWQDKFTGTGGGWAAARPKAKTYDQRGNAVGYVTNAITSGHKIRKPSGNSKSYRPRIRKSYVPGKGFYADAQNGAELIARRAMERFERRLKEAMG